MYGDIPFGGGVCTGDMRRPPQEKLYAVVHIRIFPVSDSLYTQPNSSREGCGGARFYAQKGCGKGRMPRVPHKTKKQAKRSCYRAFFSLFGTADGAFRAALGSFAFRHFAYFSAGRVLDQAFVRHGGRFVRGIFKCGGNYEAVKGTAYCGRGCPPYGKHRFGIFNMLAAGISA